MLFTTEETKQAQKKLADENNRDGVGPHASLAQTYFNKGNITPQDVINISNHDDLICRSVELTDENGKTWLGMVFDVLASNGPGTKLVVR